MSKHTPGPWRFTSRPHDGNYMRIHCSSDPNEGDNLRGYCGEANARLIAAAPDLLEACKAMLACCYDLERNDETIAAVETTRAAIAKATGELP